MVQSGAVSESGSDAATQEALYSPSVESGENGRWAFLSLLRKWRCFWAFFTEEPVFRHQVMFSARWTPRDFVFFTVSTGEPWMFSGSWSLCALRKSTTISMVLSIFRDRLLTLHQVISCSTSSLYDDSWFLSMRTITVEQQWTEHPALRCPCAWSGGVGVIISDPDFQKIQDPVAEGCVQAQQAQLPSQVLGDDCVEC